jgi:COMPASS component SWD3
MRWRPQTGLSKTQNILVSTCADGTIKYWHTTSGKLIHTHKEEGNSIYCLDYNYDGTRLVTGGLDTHLRLYDDAAKDIIHTFKDGSNELISHFNRVFSVKFDPVDDRIIYSGGWDKMININDTREKFPVNHIIGPYLAADTIDINKTELLVGNYSTKNPLEIYDIRKLERLKTIEWKTEGGKPGGLVLGAMYSKPDADAIIA